MYSRPLKPLFVAALLATGLAAAQAQTQATPAAAGDAVAAHGPLDTTLHLTRQAPPTLPGVSARRAVTPDPHHTAAARATHDVEHPLTAHIELLTGYDPYAVHDALDFKPRVGVYAVGIKVDL